MRTKTITRKQLYDQVWSKPMCQLATEYGISDVGLAKTCRKHDIPRPPRGYWAKKEFGKAPPPTPLPKKDDDCEIVLRDPDSCKIASPALRQAVEKDAGIEERKEVPIAVAETLRGAHELVSQARQELQSAKTDDNRLIVLPEKSPLSLRVSKDSLRRALLIMDALLKGLEQRGYQVAGGPTVRVLDCDLSFSIAEALDTEREQPQDHDLSGRYEFGHSRFNTKRVPSGRLSLSIDAPGYWANGCRKTWRDSKKQRIEDRLNQFVAGLIRVAGRKKEYEEEQRRKEEERQERERRRKEEAERRAELRRLFKAEQERVNSLVQEAESWTASQTLRRYIEARRQKHIAENGTIEIGGEFAQWFVWATQQADRLDPMKTSPPSILDEPIPEEPEPKSWWERTHGDRY